MNSRARKLVAQALDGFLRGPESDKFRSLALSRCQDKAQAQELEQEACRRALDKAEHYDPARSFAHWIDSILCNTAADMRRSPACRRFVSLDAEIPGKEERLWETMADDTPSALDLLERRETLEQLRRSLGRLPAQHREILSLCDIEAMSYEEAARRLGVPLGTVRSRLARARAALRRRMKAYR